MRITKRKLQRIIREERRLLEQRQQLHEANAQYVAEGLGDIIKNIGKWAKTGASAIKNVGSFVAGVRTFLEDNKEWIDPLWEMLKDLRNEEGVDVDYGAPEQLAFDFNEAAERRRRRRRLR